MIISIQLLPPAYNTDKIVAKEFYVNLDYVRLDKNTNDNKSFGVSYGSCVYI
jgi:hypothetical protein